MEEMGVAGWAVAAVIIIAGIAVFWEPIIEIILDFINKDRDDDDDDEIRPSFGV